MPSEAQSPDQRAKHVWSLGSYADIAPNFLGIAAHLVTFADIAETETVLDIACGTGNVAITAARRGANVTGLDLVPAMIDEARANARIANVETIDWREGSATDLPFDEETFDATLSCLGHMFAEPAEAAGHELLRVTRPGGRIAFGAWTPSGPVPAMGAVLADYLPPNPDRPEPPFRWGDRDVVRERLGDGVDGLTFETGSVATPTLSPEHYWKKAATEAGMFIAALGAIDEADHPALREDMIDTVGQYFDDSQNAVPMEYLLARGTAT